MISTYADTHSDVQHDAKNLEDLLRNLPGYTPEWSPEKLRAAYALLASYAHLIGILDARIERMPERDLLAYLDMLGQHLLPASAARAPLVFSLAPDTPVSVTLPAGSQAAAIPNSVAPLLGVAPAAAPEPMIFATDSTITLTPGHLVSLYSIDPAADRYADHSAKRQDGFSFFSAMELTPHHLYLGHDQLFTLGGSVTLIVSFVLQQAARSPVSLVWEYYADAGWLPLPFRIEDDTTGGLTADGQITLARDCGPNAKKTTIAGRESFWLRARVTTPLEPEALAPLVVINDLKVRVAVRKQGLQLDAAFADAVALDASKDFYPFGAMPTLSSTFYLACKDAFSRSGANVSIAFTLSDGCTVTGQGVELAWEYSTADGWAELSVAPKYLFSNSGAILFASPSDWAEREANGVKQRWLRARISKGNYGRAAYVDHIDANHQPVFGGGNLTPPVLKSALVSFQHLTDAAILDHCVTYNDFVYADVTAAARWPDTTFVPFTSVADRVPAVHFGFDHAFPDGLASLFIAIDTQIATSEFTAPFVWEYRAADGWHELAVLDETQGFRASGMIQFVVPEAAASFEGLGGKTYQLRARVKRGEPTPSARVTGIWLNAVWASQRNTVTRELAGRSDGNPGQCFRLTRVPVLENEIVEVEEWQGNGDAWRAVLGNLPAANMRFDKDPASGATVAAWVRWQRQDNFYSSSSTDRHYLLERATGRLQFGANVPTAGKRIVVSYTSGGGVAGNVAVGAIKQLRTAAPYVIGVSNVIAAQGGADREDIGGISLRGPQHLRHRDRGVAARDLEWVAREASPEVARAHCLPITGGDGRAQRGWVTLLIVPNSLEAQPALSAELAIEVHRHVATRMPAGARVRVIGPQYSLVCVHAVVIPTHAGEAAIIEARVRAALDAFLHPLRGGREGCGWTFGETVYLSHVASIIEGIEGVEHAEAIELQVDGVLHGMSLPIAADKLVAAGAHELILRVGAR